MTVSVLTRAIESAEAAEFHVTAVPTGDRPARRQAEELFSAVRAALVPVGGRVFQERVFGTRGALAAAAEVRPAIYGDLDDGVEPAWLVVGRGACGELAGVQVHAVRTPSPPAAVHLGGRADLGEVPSGPGLSSGLGLRAEGRAEDGRAAGRIVTVGTGRFLAVSGLSAPSAGAAPDQARAMLAGAERLLHSAGGDFRSVTRTWMWLGDILAWYDQFNRVRTGFFRERGLLGVDRAAARPPASTGVGIAPVGGGACGMDLVAAIGYEHSVQLLQAGGNQGPAGDYGSSFARAARVKTPAGETVYVSGTAAIDGVGRTVHVGDAPAQIAATIDNVRAILRDTRCADADVVAAIVYCKTPQVEQAFRAARPPLPWPHLVVISDICRDDLLFEIEATACPGAHF